MKSKATEDEIKELDKVTLVAYMLDLYNSPDNKKEYEKTILQRLCPLDGRSRTSVNNVNKYI